MEKIGVIGAGITGLFSALNLALDGYDVTLFDREYILSGTSGKFHGMLHSGSRVLLGVVIGAEYPVASSYIAEVTPDNKRGYYLALVNVFFSIGAIF